MSGPTNVIESWHLGLDRSRALCSGIDAVEIFDNGMRWTNLRRILNHPSDMVSNETRIWIPILSDKTSTKPEQKIKRFLGLLENKWQGILYTHLRWCGWSRWLFQQGFPLQTNPPVVEKSKSLEQRPQGDQRQFRILNNHFLPRKEGHSSRAIRHKLTSIWLN